MAAVTEEPETSSIDLALFVETTPDGDNDTELFIKYPNNGTSTQLVAQISDQPMTPIGTSGGTAAQGWCYFPSGFMLRWGTYTQSGSGSYNITLNTGPLFGKNSGINTSYGMSSPKTTGNPYYTGPLIYTSFGTNTSTTQTVYTITYGGATYPVTYYYLLTGTN